jgi:cytoskeleton protein RodZ
MARGLKKKSQAEAPEFGAPEVVPLVPVDAAPQTVGALLRTKREEFGIDLREAADFLRIRYVYLLAIEEGQVDNLPGATYAMGFVRAYADYVGLDGPSIVERYKDETAELGDDIRLVFPSPVPEGKVPSGAILLVAVVALALVYGGWVLFAQQNVKIAELVPALPESFRAFLGSDETDVSKNADATLKETPSEVVATPSAVISAPQDAVPEKTDPVNVAPDTPETSTPETSTPETSTPKTSTPKNRPAREEPAVLVVSPENSPPTEKLEQAAPSNVTVTAPLAPAVTTIERPDTNAAAEPVRASESTPSAAASAAVAISETAPALQTVAPPAPESLSTAVETGSSGGAATAEKVDQAASAPAADTPSAPVVTQDVPQEAAASDGGVQQQDAAVSTASVQEKAATPEAPVSREIAALPPKPPASAPAEPREYGTENIGSRVTIKARIDAWVEIRDPGGNLLLTRVLRAGDSYSVPNKPGLLMLTGNAGGLEITVDGVGIPDIGPKGAVRRDVLLNAESLKAAATR